jgi:hypothetical protein
MNMVATEEELGVLVQAVGEAKRKKDYSGVHSVIDMILSHWLIRNECRLCLIRGSCDRKFCVRFQIFLNVDRKLLRMY